MIELKDFLIQYIISENIINYELRKRAGQTSAFTSTTEQSEDEVFCDESDHEENVVDAREADTDTEQSREEVEDEPFIVRPPEKLLLLPKMV
jgi:hypothetical protein